MFGHTVNSPEWKLKLIMEFTGPDTPQRNYLAKIGFAVIWRRARAIMEDAGVPDKEKRLLYREAISHAIKMDRFTLTNINGITKTRFKYLFGQNPKFVNYFRTWGETGVAKEPTGQKQKLRNRGQDGML